MISINATLLVQIINLLVLILILNRLMYRPLRRLMAERAASLEGGRDQARALRDQAAGEDNAYRQRLRQGRQAVRQRLDQVRRGAEEQARQVLEEAQEAARRQSEEVVAVIQKEMAAARGEIKGQAEQVSRQMASRVLGREVS
ncbi:MAG: hypothetical protein AB1814_15290 [Thermodesulfobacteriota bacterium]